MDKILSARVDESVIHQVSMLARELNTSKKAVIEAAIRLYSERTELDKEIDVFEKTCGAWDRTETPQESVARARSAFNESMKRRHL